MVQYFIPQPVRRIRLGQYSNASAALHQRLDYCTTGFCRLDQDSFVWFHHQARICSEPVVGHCISAFSYWMYRFIDLQESLSRLPATRQVLGSGCYAFGAFSYSRRAVSFFRKGVTADDFKDSFLFHRFLKFIFPIRHCNTLFSKVIQLLTVITENQG